MIRLWRGFHSRELLAAIRETWSGPGGDLLIVCPPSLSEFKFLDLLPAGPFELAGDWSGAPRPDRKAGGARRIEYPSPPVLGVFTSGTVTGKPRLVLYSRECVQASLRAIRSLFVTSRIQRIFCYPQPFHTFGLVLGYVHALDHGLELQTGTGRYSPAFHEQWLEASGPGLLTLGTPTHFHDLLEHSRRTGEVPRPSYSCIIGGAKTPVGLWHALRDELRIEAPSIGYGATEASPGVTHLPPGHAPLEEGEIGFALPEVSLSTSAAGLRLTGPNLCLATIDAGRIEFPSWILLRDQIRAREDGVLIFEGRTDWMLNRGGQKFSLERIEQVLSENLQLQSICVALPDERLGEELGVLLVVNRDGAGRERMTETLLDRFGNRFGSARITQVREIPLTENGKPDRRRAAEILSGRSLH